PRQQMPWCEHQSGKRHEVHNERQRDHPLQARRLLHPIAEDIGDVHYRSPGFFVTRPTFSTPASFSRSVTCISSPNCTPVSPRRNTSFFVACSSFWRTVSFSRTGSIATSPR